LGQSGQGIIPKTFQVSHKKLNRLFFQSIPHLLLIGKDRQGTATEGTMIQEGDSRFQRPVSLTANRQDAFGTLFHILSFRIQEYFKEEAIKQTQHE
jgi:hypothetical protein